jgi:hypothetical protein
VDEKVALPMNYEQAREWVELRGGEVSRELMSEDHFAWVVSVFSKEGRLFRSSEFDVDVRVGVVQCVEELRRDFPHLK